MIKVLSASLSLNEALSSWQLNMPSAAARVMKTSKAQPATDEQQTDTTRLTRPMAMHGSAQTFG